MNEIDILAFEIKHMLKEENRIESLKKVDALVAIAKAAERSAALNAERICELLDIIEDDLN